MAGEHGERDDLGHQDEIPGVPGWVKVLGISLAVLVVVILLVMVISGGQHGPGRHM